MYSNPLLIYFHCVPKSLHIPSTSYNFLNPSIVPMTTSVSSDLTISTLVQTFSKLQQHLSQVTQSKYNIPTYDLANPLSLDIIHVVKNN